MGLDTSGIFSSIFYEEDNLKGKNLVSPGDATERPANTDQTRWMPGVDALPDQNLCKRTCNHMVHFLTMML